VKVSWQSRNRKTPSSAAGLFGSPAHGLASRIRVKHNLLLSLGPPEGGLRSAPGCGFPVVCSRDPGGT
jgi:hypothetical protein